jgi:peroxiredoxin Q/BCP
LARLRDGYDRFQSRGVEILAIGPHPPVTFEQYWRNESIPFISLPDPDHKIAVLYRQEVNLFKMGRMPLSCIVDANGDIRFVHYGVSMRDIPPNEELLQVIDALNDLSK